MNSTIVAPILLESKNLLIKSKRNVRVADSERDMT